MGYWSSEWSDGVLSFGINFPRRIFISLAYNLQVGRDILIWAKLYKEHGVIENHSSIPC